MHSLTYRPLGRLIGSFSIYFDVFGRFWRPGPFPMDPHRNSMQKWPIKTSRSQIWAQNLQFSPIFGICTLGGVHEISVLSNFKLKNWIFYSYHWASYYCQEIIGIIIFKFPEYGKISSRGDPNESPNLDRARLKCITHGEYIFLAGRLYSVIFLKNRHFL